MRDLNELFGTQPREEKQIEDTAMGYQQGYANGEKILAIVIADFANQSPAFREAMLEGLRDAL